MSLLLLTAKKKFSPLSWFSKGEQGAWYDPSDLTTLFQDSAGTTPVTLSPMEQPVGLMLDKSKGLALGAELVAMVHLLPALQDGLLVLIQHHPLLRHLVEL